MSGTIELTGWRIVTRNKRKTVDVICPQCGTIGELDHEIGDNGEITPSLQCGSCSFHESNCRLAGFQKKLLE